MENAAVSHTHTNKHVFSRLNILVIENIRTTSAVNAYHHSMFQLLDFL